MRLNEEIYKPRLKRLFCAIDYTVRAAGIG
jgi:hypothetical protein